MLRSIKDHVLHFHLGSNHSSLSFTKVFWFVNFVGKKLQTFGLKLLPPYLIVLCRFARRSSGLWVDDDDVNSFFIYS